MPIVRTEDEIEDVRNEADEQRHSGKTKWSGMTYEDGVAETLAWVVGDNEESPMAE